jgi:probable addiction module antidote protein
LMMLSLDTAYRSFGGEVEASSTPTICRLSDSRRHQLWAIALCEAIGAAAKIHDIQRIAEQAKIARTSVYRAFSGPRLPRFQTVLHVLDAMGLQMRVTLTADVVHVPTNVVTLPPKPASPPIRGIHRQAAPPPTCGRSRAIFQCCIDFFVQTEIGTCRAGL